MSPFANHAVYLLSVTIGCSMNFRSIVFLNASKLLPAITASSHSFDPAERVGIVFETERVRRQLQRPERVYHDGELFGARLSDRPFVCAGMRPVRDPIRVNGERCR